MAFGLHYDEDLAIPDRGLINLNPRANLPKRGVLDGQTAIGNTTVCLAGRMNTILDLRGDDECARVVTIALFNPDQFLPNRAGVPLAANANPGQQPGFAFIEFGAGGASAVALIDVGQTFALPCSSLRISVIYSPVDIVVAPVAPASIRLGAFACYAPVSHGLPPTFTTTIGAVGIGGTSALTLIAPFARGLNVYRTPQTCDYVLRIHDGVGNIIMAVNVPALADPFTLALPGQARFWSLVNGAVAMLGAQGVELLAL